MIIFYDTKTGKIIGTIEGRIHGKEHLNMWIGKRSGTSRIVYNWKKNKLGKYEPDVRNKTQKEILKDVDKRPTIMYNFMVDVAVKKLVKKKAYDN